MKPPATGSRDTRPRSDQPPSFREVVAYLHGVADAVQTLQTGPATTWGGLEARIGANDAEGHESAFPRARHVTLRFGDTRVHVEAKAHSEDAFDAKERAQRGGTRLIELAPGSRPPSVEVACERGRTLPYWAPAVTVAPHRAEFGSTPPSERAGLDALPYAALALSLVPIAPSVPSYWPESSDERTSAVRLRCAPISPDLYALTGTDESWEGHRM